MATKQLAVFSGNANKPLADEICRKLEIPPGQVRISRFADGEIFVRIEENVRNVDCFVIQSTSSPVNDNLMELLIMIDALRRASARSIAAIIPYYGYARQDRKDKPRTPISSKLVANLLTTAGATRVLVLDLHAAQIQGFFDIPMDHLYAFPVIYPYLREKFRGEDIVLVSPDAGGVERCRYYSAALEAPIAIIDKRRPKPNHAEVMNIVGDVKGRKAIIVDDMIDTAGTLTKAAEALISHGAAEVYAVATHGVLSPPAVERIRESALKEVVITNTIPLANSAAQCSKIKQLTVAELLAEAIKRIYLGDSISSLFNI